MAAFGQYDEGAAPGHREEFELLPESNDYYGVVVESEVKPNSKQTGTVLKLTWELQGEFKGRKVWQQINVQHKTAVTQEIGQRELANVKAACGIHGTLQDTLQLHNKPARLHIGIELADRDAQGNYSTKYKDKNVVKDVFPVDADVQAPAPAAAPAQPAAAPQATSQVAQPAQPAANAPAGASTPPWLKKAAA